MQGLPPLASSFVAVAVAVVGAVVVGVAAGAVAVPTVRAVGNTTAVV